jgi:hypothetical protein
VSELPREMQPEKWIPAHSRGCLEDRVLVSPQVCDSTVWIGDNKLSDKSIVRQRRIGELYLWGEPVTIYVEQKLASVSQFDERERKNV